MQASGFNPMLRRYDAVICTFNVGFQRLIIHSFKDDPYPALYADVGRTKERFGVVLDEGFLYTCGCGYPDRHPTILMMVVCEHHKHAFLHEKRRFAVGEFFRHALKRCADASYTFDHDCLYCPTCSWLQQYRTGSQRAKTTNPYRLQTALGFPCYSGNGDRL